MNKILQNLSTIRARITGACEKMGRDTQEVKLLLATKTVPAEKIKIALQAGETLLGENKVQELKAKFDSLKAVPHYTHFIGHLQSNKVGEVLKYADCIQSVDRLSLAKKIQRRLEFDDRTIDIFLQVNTSYEQSKFGVVPENALAFALQVSQLNRLRIKGLMTIGLFSAEHKQVLKCFQLLVKLQQGMLDKDIPVHELSMGMSGDLEPAIAEGATIVRVGTAILVKEPTPTVITGMTNKHVLTGNP